MADRLTIPDVIDRFRAYFLEHGPEWDSLHVVLADGNTEDDSVRFCMGWAAENGDREGEELAGILLRLTSTQRRKLPAMLYDEMRRR